MSVVTELLNCTDGRWAKAPAANPQTLKNLLEGVHLSLPIEYFDFLRVCNGGSGALDVDPYWLRLWPAEDVLDNQLGYEMDFYVPNFFAFGDCQGGDFFAFDIREQPISRVYALPLIPMEEKYANLVADNFIDLLKHVIFESKARSTDQH